MVIRTAGNPAALIPEVRYETRAGSANFGIDRLAPVAEILSGHESQRKFNAWLPRRIRLIALLASFDIYGAFPVCKL